MSPNILSAIPSQVVWFNTHIKIDNKSLCNNSLPNQGINHLGQLFDKNGIKKVWLDIKPQFILSNKQHYFWIQLINAIPKSWKEELRRSNHILDALSVYDHHLIRKNQIYSLDKCNSKLMAYSVCFFMFFLCCFFLFFWVFWGFFSLL